MDFQKFLRFSMRGSFVFFVPLFVHAQPQNLQELVNSYLLPVFRVFVPLFIGLAVLAILWGGVKFVASAANESERTKGKQVLMWGIIGLFFMISIWGFVQILLGVFDIQPEVPFFPSP